MDNLDSKMPAPLHVLLIAADDTESVRAADRLARGVPAAAWIWDRVDSLAEAGNPGLGAAWDAFLVAGGAKAGDSARFLTELRNAGGDAPTFLLWRNAPAEEAPTARAAGAAGFFDTEGLTSLELERRVREAVTRERRRREASLSRLRNLVHRLLMEFEIERKTVALDIHDAIGAELSALRYSLERKLPHLPEAQADALRVDIVRIEQLSAEIRRIQGDLRPCVLDDIGIGAAFRWHLNRFRREHPRIRAAIAVEVFEDRVPEPLKIVLFRIFQDALDNAVRHSGGDRVDVRLEMSGDEIRLEVADDGAGMEEEAELGNENGLGLDRMRERAALSGGRLRLDSPAEGGLRVTAVWPLDDKRPD